MDSVFVVRHLHVLPNAQEDTKFIGVYRSSQAAHEAVQRLRTQPGFRELPEIVDSVKGTDECGFYIEEYQLDIDHWTEGYETL